MSLRDPAGQGPVERETIDRERSDLLHQVESRLEIPMVVLGLVWLLLLVVELTRGLSELLVAAGTVIWIVFILDFTLRFALAPRKGAYLRRNALVMLSLAVPALRVLRAARALRVLRYARAARGLRLFRLVASVNRGMRALGRAMDRRGFGYVMALTVLVTLAGSAGMYAFERNPGGRGLNDFGTALWWTAMIITTVGSEYWPQTPEGRILCFLLSVYAFAVFGYVAATIAAFFIDRDAESGEAEVASDRSIRELRAEVASLRNEVGVLLRRERGSPGGDPP